MGKIRFGISPMGEMKKILMEECSREKGEKRVLEGEGREKSFFRNESPIDIKMSPDQVF